MRDVRDDGGLKEAEKWSSVEWEEGRLNGRGTQDAVKGDVEWRLKIEAKKTRVVG